MIEIIKAGSPKFEAKCPNCGTLFSFQEEDANEWRDPASAWGGYDVKCPICGHKVEVGQSGNEFARYIAKKKK